MEALSISDYRNNLSACFDMAQMGGQVLIKRRNQMFALVRIEPEAEAPVASDLQRAIDNAVAEYRAGKCVVCNTKEELHNLLDSL